ncbi:MAG: bifunctional diaminohydroxyphosphoribosylaminopyrimidine deaminase/5-amino-6-(5-phosphoribosylamino)uracil reductase RibD [Tatlockia sp.]|nr:bifunctional diaminohydroxyphosphoribosylaminopyrimidine deaminase/5-amino-6-(5-phosphoribosylamino)uracil reductase RibD [Tatlockia sp.]
MHEYFMLAALEQAWLGRGNCAPNPSVGAIIVHKGEIIARAWHRGAGTAHAEQLALEQIALDLTDLILYVTLEPCNHWGKTPPCTASIIQHKGIAQVIYGFADPNPLVAANDTPQLLKNNGIEVLHFPLAEVDHFYQSYSYWIQTKKPWIKAKMAQSLDGKIGKPGERVYLSNNECGEFTHLNRLHSDVILTTAKTIFTDDPLLNARVEGREQSKIVAIIDSKLTLNAKNAKIFHSAKHCHIYHDENLSVVNAKPNCTYHAVPVDEKLLDLFFIVNHLGELGFHDVWVEAGGQLFSALHRQKLLQQTYLYITPMILGAETLAAFTGDTIFSDKLKISWQIKADNVIACIDLQET